MDVSVVIPVFNEQESIAPLHSAVIRALDAAEITFELILVDDGSTDQTFERAAEIAMEDPRFRVIKLKTNFGQTAALHAGFEAANGSIIVTLDGDMQNDPADIPALLDKLDEGYDMVAGWRVQRKDGLISRRLPSWIANWLIRATIGTSIRDNGCALRAYRAAVLKHLPLYSEMHRLLPLILSLMGSRVTDVPVRHHPRQFGRSKYGLSRTYKVVLDLIALRWVLTRHQSALFGFGMSALILTIVNFAIFAMIAASQFVRPEVPIVVFSGVFLLLAVLGVFLLMIGILAELIYRSGHVRIDRLLTRRILG